MQLIACWLAGEVSAGGVLLLAHRLKDNPFATPAGPYAFPTDREKVYREIAVEAVGITNTVTGPWFDHVTVILEQVKKAAEVGLGARRGGGGGREVINWC